MQDEEVGDDHDEDPTNPAFVSHDQMKSGIEYQSLASDHAPPANTNENACNMSVLPDSKVEHDEAERMDGAAPGREKQTPEVKASVPFETQPDPQLQFDGIDPGESCEGGNDHGGRQVHAIVLGVI